MTMHRGKWNTVTKNNKAFYLKAINQVIDEFNLESKVRDATSI